MRSEAVCISASRDIFVVGASRGDVPALRTLVRQLPADLKASVFVAQHMAPDAWERLDELLARDARVPVRYAWDGERFTAGVVYLAPRDRHLLLEPETLRITRGPRENGERPAIDPLFRSAAAHHGSRVVGILLTGLRDDGVAGLEAIRRCGGLAVVQGPADAAFVETPRSALDKVAVDRVLPLATIGAWLLAHEGAPGDVAAPDAALPDARRAARLAKRDPVALEELERSTLVALRALEARAHLLDQLAGRAETDSSAGRAERYARERDETLTHARVIRELLAILA